MNEALKDQIRELVNQSDIADVKRDENGKTVITIKDETADKIRGKLSPENNDK